MVKLLLELSSKHPSTSIQVILIIRSRVFLLRFNPLTESLPS